MFEKIKTFKTFPDAVKKAIYSMFAAWIWFACFYFWTYLDSGVQIPYRPLIAGIAVCFCVLLIKNWARVLCMVCNVMIILQFFYLLIPSLDNLKIGVPTLLVIILFSISTYYLFIKETAEFFKANTPKIPEKEFYKTK
jgi:hypothetical protein